MASAVKAGQLSCKAFRGSPGRHIEELSLSLPLRSAKNLAHQLPALNLGLLFLQQRLPAGKGPSWRSFSVHRADT